MAKKDTGIFIRRETLALVRGDWPAAIILSQMMYWQSRLTITREGHRWLAKSYRDWQDECYLPRTTVWRAVKKLESLGLIQTRLFNFSRHATQHLRLSQGGTAASHSGTQEGGVASQKSQTTIDGLHRVLVKQTKNTKSAGEKISPAKATHAETEMNAEEQLKKFNAKHHPENGFPDTLENVNTMRLAIMWERITTHYFDPIGKTKPLTKKEIGQLSQFRKAVGNQDAYRVMKWAISNWSQFLFDITDNTGATLPSLKQPHVGVLLTHWNVALGGSKKQSTPPKKTGGVKMLSKAEKATM